MSIHVIAPILKIQFGNPHRKAVAIKLADNANDDGTSIKPSFRTVAREAEVDIRTVRRIVREWEQIGLIVMVRQGGNGPHNPSEYAFNMEMIHGLSMHAEAVKKERNAGREVEDVIVQDLWKTISADDDLKLDPDLDIKADRESYLKAVTESALECIRRARDTLKAGRGPANPSGTVNIPPLPPKGGSSEINSEEEKEGAQVIFYQVGCSEHVRKNFLKLLEGVRLRKNHNVKFFNEVCRYLENNNETALQESARRLRAMPYLPTKVNDLLKVCSSVQARHMVVIRPDKNPEEWAAWEKHIRKSMPFLADQMKNHTVSYIEKPTLYPPTSKGGRKHGA